MLEVTKTATDKIAEYFIDREISPIRVFLQAEECAPSSLALDVDEPRDTDTVFDIDGFQFIVDEDLMVKAAPIKVDYTRSGFQFDCSLDFEDECTACETSSCCC